MKKIDFKTFFSKYEFSCILRYIYIYNCILKLKITKCSHAKSARIIVLFVICVFYTKKMIDKSESRLTIF